MQQSQHGYLVMTRYEKARLLGIRAQQISNGAPPMINLDYKDPTGRTHKLQRAEDIAEAELWEKVIPLTVVRNMPGGGIEEFSVEDFDIIP